MNVIVKLLYERGVRRHDRDLASDAGIAGVLTLSLVGTQYMLKVYARADDAVRRPLLPELAHATLISLHNHKMLFRGIAHERVDAAADAPRFEQQWACAIDYTGITAARSPV